MDSREIRQQSHAYFVHQSAVEKRNVTDFRVGMESPEMENRTMLSDILETDADYVKRQAEIECFKILLIERMEKNSDMQHREMFLAYCRMVEEQLETAVCMGDMLAMDQSSKYTKNEER